MTKKKEFHSEDKYAVCPYCGVCNENTEMLEDILTANHQVKTIECPHCFHKHDVTLIFKYRTAK